MRTQIEQQQTFNHDALAFLADAGGD